MYDTTNIDMRLNADEVKTNICIFYKKYFTFVQKNCKQREEIKIYFEVAIETLRLQLGKKQFDNFKSADVSFTVNVRLNAKIYISLYLENTK